MAHLLERGLPGVRQAVRAAVCRVCGGWGVNEKQADRIIELLAQFRIIVLIGVMILLGILWVFGALDIDLIRSLK